MKSKFRWFLFAACAGALALTVPTQMRADNDKDTKPNGQGHYPKDNPPGNSGEAHSQAGPKSVVPVTYHGGPIMTGAINVYYIWYGNWASDTANSILTNLASSIGGSSYFNINTTYSDGSGNKVLNAVVLASQTTDNYSQGKTLTDAGVKAVVTKAIAGGLGPATGDPQGVYFVLTSQDVAESSGFCKTYCGWHTHGTISGMDVKYAFIGNAAQCPSACSEQTTSPNGNLGADAMASIIAHELSEAATDPDLNAWYDRQGQENADKCAWTFGATSSLSNGAKYNVTLGGTKYLIQQNWVNSGTGLCAMSH